MTIEYITMTIVDNYKPSKSYRSVNLHKFNTKPYHLYLYMEIISDPVKNFNCVKYIVLQGLLNYLPTNPIELHEMTEIKNKVSVKINPYITLNIIVVKKLINPYVIKYKFNFSFLNLNNNYIKTFFNTIKFRYKVASVTHQLQYFNVGKIEDELLCNQFDNIKI